MRSTRGFGSAAIAVPSLKALDTLGNVIQIDSFSKTAFPGLRVGWCIGPESAIERLRSLKQSTDFIRISFRKRPWRSSCAGGISRGTSRR